MRTDQVHIPPPYELVGELGAGASAAVYEVRDPGSGEVYALKLWHRSPEARGSARFEREAALLRSLGSPRVLRALDSGTTPRPWLLLPLLPDNWYRRLRRDGPVAAEVCRAVADDVLAGLEALHARGVVHRDVKPSNLLVDHHGRTVVGDLGTVRAPDSRLTGTGAMVGSILYMAPEQRRDPRSVGPQADLYGMAASLWALSLGRNPPDLSLLSFRPQLLEQLPLSLRHVVARAARADPADRFPSASAMRQALTHG